MIPLLHDFTGETVLVFGGGPVGARKARRFAREARVVVVSPDFVDADFGAAERVAAAPAPDEVASLVAEYDPALVVAATDDAAVNDAAAAAARDHGAMVNRADESGRESRPVDEVVVPATVRDGPVTVAVSTGGASPALSKYLRERIAAEVEGAGAMADLTADLRTDLREGDRSPAARRDAVRAVVRSPRVWKALGEGDAKAREEAANVIRKGVDGRD
jgi:precorrin-2 dehydrogenase/sirohydrochlorin ferrochelatase